MQTEGQYVCRSSGHVAKAFLFFDGQISVGDFHRKCSRAQCGPPMVVQINLTHQLPGQYFWSAEDASGDGHGVGGGCLVPPRGRGRKWDATLGHQTFHLTNF